MMSNLTSLSVEKCNGLEFLLSSSMARNLKKLKHLRISYCEIMEQIISTREHDEEDNLFGALKSLNLEDLPNLARFCTGKCIEFPLLEKLYIENCPQLGAFVGGSMTKSTRKGERGSKKNFDVHSDNTSLFDQKVRFPRLETLHIYGFPITPAPLVPISDSIKGRYRCRSPSMERRPEQILCLKWPKQTTRDSKLVPDTVWQSEQLARYRRRSSRLQTIWHNQLAPGSFCRLREVNLQYYYGFKNVFPPSMMGRLHALETLYLSHCELMEVVFDEHRETNVNETHDTSTTQLKDGQNLISVTIDDCRSLKNVFPASMAARCLQQLQKLDVRLCPKMENIVAKEEGGLELTTTHPKFVFPKVKSLRFVSMCSLRSFYPGQHASKWPLLKDLDVVDCYKVEFLAAELSIFQERHPHAPTKQPLFIIDQDSFPVLENVCVWQCQSFVVIVASNGDDDARKNEIAFRQLKHLTLKNLPSLQGFSSGNCIAKLPLSLIPTVIHCPIKLKISSDGVPIPKRLERTKEKLKPCDYIRFRSIFDLFSFVSD